MNVCYAKRQGWKVDAQIYRTYKVMKTYLETSNYMLELPPELAKRQVHPKYHVSLLRPHHPNDDALFPNRRKAEQYNFGAPEDTEWYVDEIIGH
jgi:hypothetical protein